MNGTGNYSLVLSTVWYGHRQMKYGKIIFWLFTTVIIVQAIAPINGVNSKLNNTFVLVFRLDYLVHAAMFACLSVLFRMAYFPQPDFNFSRGVLFFGVMLATAFFSEALQWLVPYRVFNSNDLIANFLGVLISIPLMRPFRFFFQKGNKICKQI